MSTASLFFQKKSFLELISERFARYFDIVLSSVVDQSKGWQTNALSLCRGRFHCTTNAMHMPLCIAKQFRGAIGNAVGKNCDGICLGTWVRSDNDYLICMTICLCYRCAIPVSTAPPMQCTLHMPLCIAKQLSGAIANAVGKIAIACVETWAVLWHIWLLSCCICMTICLCNRCAIPFSI